jgi:adenylate cyclase class 2
VTNFIETEIKLYVPDLVATEAHVRAAGATLVAPRVFERNYRYDDEQGTIRANHQVVRLRQDSRARFTYKEDVPIVEGAGVMSRFEAEVEVSDFDAMHEILSRLGYHPYMSYEKYRTTYELDSCEIVLDELPFGNFVEIEGTAEAIAGVRTRIGLDDAPAITASYVTISETLGQWMGLNFSDLTFRNFQDVEIPADAFQKFSS